MAVTIGTGEIQGARHVVRTSTGKVYVVLEDAGSVKCFYGGVTPSSFTEKDAGNAPTTGGLTDAPCAVAIDSDDVLHVVYYKSDGTDNDLYYNKFHTVDSTQGDDAWNTAEVAIPQEDSDNTTFGCAIAVDSNDKPHACYVDSDVNKGKDYDTVYYANKTGANWSTKMELRGVTNESNCAYPDIGINSDNYPVIVFLDDSNDDIYAYRGIGNDPGGFNYVTVDSSVLSGATNKPSICVDSNGDAWVAYVDSDGTIDIAEQSANWVDAWTIASNGNSGTEPSIVADGTDIYVFYEEDGADDIVCDKYTGAWLGETQLQTTVAYNSVKARWAYNHLSSFATYGIDYVFDDGTNILWGNLSLAVGGTSYTEHIALLISSLTTSTEHEALITAAVSSSSENEALLSGAESSSIEHECLLVGDLGSSTEQEALLAGSFDINSEHEATIIGSTTTNLEHEAIIAGAATANTEHEASLPGSDVSYSEHGAILHNAQDSHAEHLAVIPGSVTGNTENEGILPGNATSNTETEGLLPGSNTTSVEHECLLGGENTSNIEHEGLLLGSTATTTENEALLGGSLTSNTEHEALLSGGILSNTENVGILPGSNTGTLEHECLFGGHLSGNVEHEALLAGSAITNSEHEGLLPGSLTSSSEHGGVITGFAIIYVEHEVLLPGSSDDATEVEALLPGSDTTYRENEGLIPGSAGSYTEHECIIEGTAAGQSQVTHFAVISGSLTSSAEHEAVLYGAAPSSGENEGTSGR